MEINIWAVLAISVVSIVLGFVWYGPMLFAKAWMDGLGIKEEDIKGGPGIGYLISTVASAIMGATTSLLVHRLGITSLVDGLLLGLMLGVGYVATTFGTNYIFQQKSIKLYLIDAGYQVILITLAGLIATLLK